MTTKENSVLYTGVTANLGARVLEHKMRVDKSCFTSRYCVEKLVYFRVFGRIEEAIAEEKRLKGGSRAKKVRLINQMNPEWEDLWETRLGRSR